MSNHMAIIKLVVDIIDPQRLRAYAMERAAIYHRGPDELDSLGDCAAESMITSAPGPTPESVGVELTRVEPRQLDTSVYGPRCVFRPAETWLIEVLATIWNPPALRAYASHRYKACWNKHLTFVNNDEQAVYEAIVGSSEGPPPNHYGVRLVQWAYRPRTPA